MKTTAAGLLTGLALVALAAASNVTGTWDVEATFDDSRISGGGFYCALTQEGERLSGKCSEATSQLTGAVNGQNISWRLQKNGSAPATAITFTGTLDEAGTHIQGRFTAGDQGGRFTAVKQ